MNEVKLIGRLRILLFLNIKIGLRLGLIGSRNLILGLIYCLKIRFLFFGVLRHTQGKMRFTNGAYTALSLSFGQIEADFGFLPGVG